MPRKILLVDDDKELTDEIAETLSDEGFSVEVALDGIQGEDLAKKSKYDVILFDFKLPGLNGAQMIKRVKQKSPGSKIFLISGRPFIEKLIEEEGLGDLISGYMNKPFNIEMLLEKIK
ncbi:MAG: response regulator [Candidatus Omnitrophica bacterium]|nr:response regulator [Candidatus Omnitrophota bacterium]